MSRLLVCLVVISPFLHLHDTFLSSLLYLKLRNSDNSDPWEQGLGIFDMTQLQWTNGYDAEAATYQTPQVVSKWFSQK